MVFVYDLWFVLIKLNIQKNMSFPIPHSPFLILHSSFLIPHSSFPIPHSSFLIPHYYITALTIPAIPKIIKTAPVILFNISRPFSLNSLVLTIFTNSVRVNHHIVAPSNIDAMPTMLKNGSAGFTILNRANSPIKRKIITIIIKDV